MSTPNQIQLRNGQFTIGVTEGTGSFINLPTDKELLVKAPNGNIKVKAPNEEGVLEEFNLTNKLTQLQQTVTNNNSATNGVQKDIADATADVLALEQRQTTFETDINTFKDKYNTADVDANGNPEHHPDYDSATATLADSSSVHSGTNGQRPAIKQLIADRKTDLGDADTTITNDITTVRTGSSNNNSLQQLGTKKNEMVSNRQIEIQALRGVNASALDTNVTQTTTTKTDEFNKWLENCELLCSEHAQNQLQALLDDIAEAHTADGALFDQVSSFATSTYNLIGDFQEVVQSTENVTATITSAKKQGTDKPELTGTIVMAANKKFYLYFNNIAFDITPAENGVQNWSLNFTSDTDLAEKKLYGYQSLESIVRHGSSKFGDQNEVVIIEYNLDANNDVTLDKIAASQRLFCDTVGPVLTSNAVAGAGLTSPDHMADITVSGSAGETGAVVHLVEEISGGHNRKWEKTTAADGLFSFKPYSEAPTSGTGGTFDHNSQQHTLHLEARDVVGNTTQLGSFHITPSFDNSVTNYTITSGPKYNTLRPTISGTVEPLSTVTLIYGGTTMTATANEQGAWSLVMTKDLPDSSTTALSLQAQDIAGNTADLTHNAEVHTGVPTFSGFGPANSETSPVTVNAVNPTIPGVVGPVPSEQYGGVQTNVTIEVNSYTIQNGQITFGETSTVTGTVNSAGAIGNYDLGINTAGKYRILYHANNSFGRSSEFTYWLSYDPDAPTVAFNNNTMTANNPTGLIAMSGTWTDVNPDNEEPTIKLEITDSNNNVGTYTVGNITRQLAAGDNRGQWFADVRARVGDPAITAESGTTFAFTDGTYTVKALVEDQSGNTGNASASLLIDTVLPEIDLTATDALQDNGSSWILYAKVTEINLKSVALSIPGAGGGSYTVTSAFTGKSGQTVALTPGTAPLSAINLPDGTYAMTLTVVDTLNNQRQVSRDVTIDSTAPVLASFQPSTAQTTSDQVIAMNGVVNEQIQSVHVSYAATQGGTYTGGGNATINAVTGQGWSISASNVPYSAAVSVKLVIKDTAGNQTITYKTFQHIQEQVAVEGNIIDGYTASGFGQFTDLFFDAGQSQIALIVTEHDNFEYMNVHIHGENHRVNKSDLINVPAGRGGNRFPGYAGNAAYKFYEVFTGAFQSTYLNGVRVLHTNTSGLTNPITVDAKWSGHNLRRRYELQQTYTPYVAGGF